MSESEQLDRALADWARSGVPLEEGEAPERRRARIVARMQRTIRDAAAESVRRRRVRRWAMVFGAAAAVALVLGVVGFSMRPTGEHARQQVAQGPRALSVGDEARTGHDGRATVRAGSASIDLAPSSRLTLVESSGGSQLVKLDAGSIEVAVPKLESPATFAVQTPDARVVVHGTRFTVTVLGEAEPSPRTRVRVFEGVVSVLYAGKETFVSAGASWPGGSAVPERAKEPAPESAPTAPPRSTHAAHDSAPHAPKGAAESRTPSPHTSVALAEQNRMFSLAVTSRRRGDDRAALAELDRLLAKYPDGPLAPEARVERFRALKRLGDEQAAAREAKKYLLENKDGHATDEARELVLPSKPK